jgi:hypothetical protein
MNWNTKYPVFQFVNPKIQLGGSIAPIYLLPTLAKDAVQGVDALFDAANMVPFSMAAPMVAVVSASTTALMRA